MSSKKTENFDSKMFYCWYKTKYSALDKKNNDKYDLKPLFGVAFIAIVVLPLILYAFNIMQYLSEEKTYVVTIDTDSGVIHTTSERFLSFGLDSSLLRDMKTFPVREPGFKQAAQLLSPAFVRIGGTSADCLFFNETSSSSPLKITSPVDDQDISNFSLSQDDYLAIYEFANYANLRMLFDLNVLLRNGEDWDSSNAEQMIKFSKSHDMDIDWQLGNEPNSFKHVFNRPISAKQLGQDYDKLRQLLNELGYKSSILVGPEVNHIGDVNERGEHYATEFLENSNSVDFVTWHQYYLNGHIAKLEDFINPEVFKKLPEQIENVKEAIRAANKTMDIWISETSSAYGGGAANLSDRFVAGFLWLDKLGISASAGVNVVIRQSFFGGNYAMIGQDLHPNPDFWLSYMYKLLVSPKVLKLKTSNDDGTVRFYAHCFIARDTFVKDRSVVLYGMNLNNAYVKLSIDGNYFHLNSSIQIGIFNSDHLQSRKMMWNGHVLSTFALNWNLSEMKLKTYELTYSPPLISLPPYSMAFIILNGTNIKACDL